jgi:CRP-like cAMP-binding protein
MEINNKVKNIIEKYPELWNKIQIEKGTILFEKGKFVKKIFFCEKGIIRIFEVDERTGKEITSGFFSENQLVAPVISIVKNIKIMHNFQAIEDCDMQVITLEDLKELEKQTPIIADILLNTAINILHYLHIHKKDHSACDTQKRYIKLLDDHPYLDRVKGEYIASFLGIDPTTLSRLRGKPPKK